MTVRRGPHRPVLRSALPAAAAALALGLATAGAAQAQPGSLDAAFNGDGVVATSNAQLLGVAIQSNGDVVAAGQSGGNVFAERFTPAGAAAGSYVGPAGVARAVAIEPDGDIVLAGSSGGAMLVVRLTSSLTPDTSFGSGGIASAFAGQSAVANGVAISPTGAIVAAGWIGSSTTTAAVAEFATSGSATTQTFGFGGNSALLGVAVESDGDIVVAGKRNPSQAVDGLIAWLSPDGSQLNAAIYDYPGSGATAFGGVAVQSDGQVVVGGQTNSDNLPVALFLRYDANYALDSSFGSGGVTTMPASASLSQGPGGLVGANGVGIAGGGAIVGAGPFLYGAGETYAAVWGLTSSGSADNAFGNGGTELGPPSTAGSPNYEACALAVAPDGSPDAGEIVTVGDTPVIPISNDSCTAGQSANGFVASYVGLGPPPAAVVVAGLAPAVTTGAAGSVTTTSATVAGEVNPNGSATSYYFQYGTSTAYGSATNPASAGSGASAVMESAELTKLLPGKTYHYRIVATNSDGTSYGADETFTTPPLPPLTGKPKVSTGKASSIKSASAKLGGTVDANGLATTYWFQLGKTKKLGSKTKAHELSGTLKHGVSAALKKLQASTTYHYRIVAGNAKGTSYGRTRMFKTAAGG